MKKFWGVVLKSVLFFMIWAILVGIGNIPSNNPAIWRFGAEFIPLLWTILLTVIFLLIDKKKTSIPIKNNIGESMALGGLTGLLWIGISTGILLLVGTEQIAGSNKVSMLWLWILSAFINTVMQELLVRGYLYQLIKREYNIAAATVVSTALFTLFHGGAFEAGVIPVLNVITMSLFMTALYQYIRQNTPILFR